MARRRPWCCGSASTFPVIYLTAHADGETVARAKDAGPLGYITKPFQEAALHASIEIALHRHGEELKAREKVELLASTLRAISQGVISMDRQRTITLFNPAAEAWTGRSSREALGQPVDGGLPSGVGPGRDQSREALGAGALRRFACRICRRARF